MIIAIGMIVRDLLSAHPLTDFLDNAEKYGHALDRMIVVYEDTSNYLIVETESAWYLIEIGPNSVIEKILEEGQITSRDDVLVYEISEDAYSELANLFDKTT